MGRKITETLSKEKRNKRQNDWIRKSCKRYNIAFSISNYSDVIRKLESVPAKNQYIARLVREDLRREEKKED